MFRRLCGIGVVVLCMVVMSSCRVAPSGVAEPARGTAAGKTSAPSRDGAAPTSGATKDAASAKVGDSAATKVAAGKDTAASRPAGRRRGVPTELDNLIAEGTVSQVAWSLDGKYVHYFRPGQGQMRCRLADGVIEPLKDRKAADEVALPVTPVARYRRHTSPERLPSSNGKLVAVVKDYNIVIEPWDDAAEAAAKDGAASKVVAAQSKPVGTESKASAIAVTSDGAAKYRYGTTSWIYSEDAAQWDGMWWTGDSRAVVYLRYDDRLVSDYYMTNGLTDSYPTVRTDSYPLPGGKMPVISLHVYHLDGGRRVQIDCGANPDQFIYNIRLAPDGRTLLFNRLDRAQKHMQVLAADIDTGHSRVIAEASRPQTWVLNQPPMIFLADGKRFLWGPYPGNCDWSAMEIRDLDGRLVRKLTDGNTPMTTPLRVDEPTGWYYYADFTVTGCPLNQQAWRMNLQDGRCEQMTPSRWNHSDYNISPDGKYVVARAQTLTEPPRTFLYDATGKVVATLAGANPKVLKSVTGPLPELFSFKSSDGQVQLYGTLNKPANFDAKKKYPLLLDVYNGPGSKAIANDFRPINREADRGYLVAHIDARGTSGRGYRFMEAVYAKMGDLDMQDQVDGVRLLCQRPYVDATRVGVTGGSHGGWMACLAIVKHPDVFAASVAEYGPTDWRHYSAVYPERFLGLPAEHPEAYVKASCLNYAPQLRGNLLLMYGMLDFNVHPTHAWLMIDELHRLDKPYEARFFPKDGHGLGRPADTYKWEFFERYLKPVK